MTPRRLLVMELVGPAGAGKSTLAEALLGCDRRVRSALTLWGLPRGLLLRGTAAVVGPALAATREGRPFRPAELAQMIRVSALHRAVAAAGPPPGMIVLDEGPIFGLTWLLLNFGRNGNGAWAAWRRRVIAEWAGTLDVVIRLDAPDGILTDRIRTRAKPHPVKHSPNQVINRFTEDFRRGFEEVIGDFADQGRLRVLSAAVDGSAPPEETAVRLLETLEAIHVG